MFNMFNHTSLLGLFKHQMKSHDPFSPEFRGFLQFKPLPLTCCSFVMKSEESLPLCVAVGKGVFTVGHMATASRSPVIYYRSVSN